MHMGQRMFKSISCMGVDVGEKGPTLHAERLTGAHF